MTKPISHERRVWLEERSIVVDHCINLLKGRAYGLATGSIEHREIQNSLFQLLTERITIQTELDVLEKLGVSE